jgi:deazaflavin-dependent oxidoreductase (nitroreductase family)
MGWKEVKAAPASGTRGPNPRWLRSKPAGALRLAFRLPIYLYRFDLGWLLGHRFLLLVHRGRKSSLLHQTMLEVVLYDPSIRESVVLSAWGEDADWYRNLQKGPAIEIRTGRESYEPLQRFLSPEEANAPMASYERRHPWAARILGRLLGYPLGGPEAARRAFAESVRLVAFRPT